MESKADINSFVPDTFGRKDESAEGTRECGKASSETTQNCTESEAIHFVPIAITFCYRRGRVRIHKSVISALKNPAYIRLLIHPEKKVVLIQACNEMERDAIKVPANLNRSNSEFMINSVALLASIIKLMDWSERLTYRVKGELMKETGMLVFLLETADIVREKEV